jgi:hypothetical protein
LLPGAILVLEKIHGDSRPVISGDGIGPKRLA